MTGKEYLQFLAMMVPTFVLLGALALSLAFPAGSAAPAEVPPQMAETAGDLAEDLNITALEIAYAR